MTLTLESIETGQRRMTGPEQAPTDLELVLMGMVTPDLRGMTARRCFEEWLAARKSAVQEWGKNGILTDHV
jgi:hypothetical protein